MERIIKDTDLRSGRHQCVNSADSLQMASIMNGCKVTKLLNILLNLLVNNDALIIFVPSLHDAMSHGINLFQVFNSTEFRVEQALEYQTYALFMGGQVGHNLLFLSIGQLDFDECIVQTDALYAALCQYSLIVHVV